MATQERERVSVGARSVGGGPEKGAGWLKWLVLLLLLLAAVVLLVSLLGDDDEDTAATGPAVTASDPATPSSGAAGGATASGTGALPAAGQSLLGASPDVFGGAVGEQASGRGVEVLSVVEDEGFFVGTSPQDRVYVELGGDVGENEQAAAYEPQVGDRVDLDGEVRPAPEDPGRTLRLEAEDASVVEEQGAFVNASDVREAE